jgi:hypothetical protein
MICTSCGHTARAGAVFCGECGFRLQEATVVAARAVAPDLLLPMSPPFVSAVIPPHAGTVTPLLPPPPPPLAAALRQMPKVPDSAATEMAVPAALPGDVAGGMITLPPSVAVPTSLVTAPEVPPIGDVLFFASPVNFDMANEGSTTLLASESELDLDATRVSVRRRAGSPWRLVLPNGQHFVVEKTVLVGRDPAPNPDWPGAQLLSVNDETKSVSKTHAAIELDSAGLWVTDLASTNGVIISTPNGGEIDLDGSEHVQVEPGCDIELGDFVIQVERD